MPVLARTFEQAGMSTIMVTNMPFWAERIGVPRTLAVQMPFGHILGKPRHKDQQVRIILNALQVLQAAQQPGTIVHSDETWPGSDEEAAHASHPPVHPPITAEMGRHIGSFLRGIRRNAK